LGVREVVIPYEPRAAFVPYHNAHQRFCLSVAHRRAGKTVARINKIIRKAIECKLPQPRFGYGAPTFVQAKDIAWQYLKTYTAPMVDLGLRTNESELSVVLPHNGAQIRLYGLENYDRLRGLYFDGLAIDEAQDVPSVALTQVILPALTDRNGWLDASGTPKGRAGLLYKLYQDARVAPAQWFLQVLKASETGILSADQLDMLRRTMPANEYEQEMECSFDAAITGAYYSREIDAAEKDGRITEVPYEPVLPVNTAWDLGISDSMSITFYQQSKGGQIRVIDYYEAAGYGLDHYAKELDRRGYKYGKHFGPHDLAVREIGANGRSRVESARSLGITFEVLPIQRVEDGINAVRMMLPRCVFDAKKCDRLIESLRQYRVKYDDKRQISLGPLHDHTSHAADSVRYMAQSLRENKRHEPIKYPTAGII
jgi:phage terminase large subunit